MKKIVKLTESDLVRLVNKVLNEQSSIGFIEKMTPPSSSQSKPNVMKDKLKSVSTSSPKQNSLVDKMVQPSTSKEYNMINTCSSMGVKSPGYCDTQAKKPIKLCAELGVKTPGFCYVDSKKPVPNLPDIIMGN